MEARDAVAEAEEAVGDAAAGGRVVAGGVALAREAAAGREPALEPVVLLALVQPHRVALVAFWRRKTGAERAAREAMRHNARTHEAVEPRPRPLGLFVLEDVLVVGVHRANNGRGSTGKRA